MHTVMTTKRAGAALASLGAALWALPAEAHVKWFVPYIVDAAPQPISATLTNPWFWTGIGLVLAFFLAALTVERTFIGRGILREAKALTVKVPTTLPRFGNPASVPTGLAVALVEFVIGYWGLHSVFYGVEGGGHPTEMITHTRNVEHPHGAQIVTPAPHSHH